MIGIWDFFRSIRVLRSILLVYVLPLRFLSFGCFPRLGDLSLFAIKLGNCYSSLSNNQGDHAGSVVYASGFLADSIIGLDFSFRSGGCMDC